MHAHEEGGEADKGGFRRAGIGAPGARHVGEHVVVRVLEGDAPLFVVADFVMRLGISFNFLKEPLLKKRHQKLITIPSSQFSYVAQSAPRARGTKRRHQNVV